MHCHELPVEPAVAQELMAITLGGCAATFHGNS
jgi:hypothetical protein